MTTVAFYFNVTNRLHYACRLVRKAVGAGTRLVVTGADDVLQQFDRDLWLLSATEFISHCWHDDLPRLKRRSAVLLCRALEAVPERNALLNLGDTVPAGFEAFARVFEIVDFDPLQKQQARLRWRHYSQAGLTLTQYDLQPRTAP